MQYLALLPGLISLIVLIRHGLEKAFLWVYIPTLLLLPEVRCVLPALPDPTFGQAAIFPLGVAFLLRPNSRRAFSPADLPILAFIAWAIFSEYSNKGYDEAQNYAFDLIAWGLFPYLLGKELIEPKGLRISFARMFVTCLVLICISSVYEFRFGVNPYRRVLYNAFAEMRSDVVLLRWGLARITGPFGHAIIAAAIFSVGLLLNKWLTDAGYWNSYQPYFGMGRGKLNQFVLVAGLLMTMSRGPWIGCAFGVAAAAVGRAKNYKRALIATTAILLVMSAAGSMILQIYGGVGRANAQTAEQETAAYRHELMEKYRNIALDKPLMGWGRLGWPQIPGMPSIDNEYLLIALMHGVLGLALFVFSLLAPLLRLIRCALDPAASGIRRRLLFTLAGVITGTMISIGTVYAGSQLFPVIFLMLGWSEGCIANPEKESHEPSQAPVTTGRYRFDRVYA